MLHGISSESFSELDIKGKDETGEFLKDLKGGKAGNLNEEMKILVSKIKEQIFVSRILRVNCEGSHIGCYLHNEVNQQFAPKICVVTLNGKAINSDEGQK